MVFSSPPRYRLKACKLIWSAGDTEEGRCVCFDHKKVKPVFLILTLNGMTNRCYIKFTQSVIMDPKDKRQERCEHRGQDSGSSYRFWLNSVLAERHIIIRALFVPLFHTHYAHMNTDRKTCGGSFHPICKWFPHSRCKSEYHIFSPCLRSLEENNEKII